jgi:hypothetical protein
MGVVRRDPTESKQPRGRTRRVREAEPEEKLELSLPTEMSEETKDLWQCLILLFGEKKIGKTAMMGKVRKAFFMATEPGHRGQTIFKRDVTSWREAKGYLKLLKKDKTFKVIVVDIVDRLYDLCSDYICDKLGISHPQEEDYGKGWHAVKKEFENFIIQLAQTGKGVALISHAEEREVTVRDGGKYDRIMPTMSNQARKTVEGLVDIWACFQYDGRRRVITIAGDDHVAAGHRFATRFRTPDGRPLRHIYMGRTADDALRNFEAAWRNEYEPHRDGDADNVKQSKSKIRLK